MCGDITNVPMYSSMRRRCKHALYIYSGEGGLHLLIESVSCAVELSAFCMWQGDGVYELPADKRRYILQK